MRERARDLGGRLEIDHEVAGTRVRAIVPVRAPQVRS
jgi:signal transduction histidine kinase